MRLEGGSSLSFDDLRRRPSLRTRTHQAADVDARTPDTATAGKWAGLAVQAALTGHLVFSTLHTNDALGAIPRLIDLGVPPYLIAATLDAVLAQRLVRRVCDTCRVRPAADAIPAESTGKDVSTIVAAQRRETLASRGNGCGQCHGTGYRGRIGLFELLVLTPELRNAVASGAPAASLEELAGQAGRTTLQEDGWNKVTARITTTEEVLRVTQTDA